MSLAVDRGVGDTEVSEDETETTGAPMSARRTLGALEETSEGTFGGILATSMKARDLDVWDIDAIDCTQFLDNAYVDLEHEGPPVAVVERLGAVTLSNGARALAISCRWGPLEIPLIAETQARVRAGLYNTFSAAIDPIECVPLRDGTGGVLVTKSTLLGASIVKLPADPGARITQRSFRGNESLMRLPQVPARSINRVMTRFGQPMSGARPFYQLSESERCAAVAEAHRQRTMTIWALGQASRAEERDERQADLEHLRAIGESYHARRH